MNFSSAEGRNGDCRSRRGFSLVELLAVCVVVVLVLALAPPSLQFAASQSRHALCLQRLHAIGQASLTYASTDAAESSIPVHRKQFTQDSNSPTMIGAYEWGGKSGIGQQGFVSYPGLLGSRYGTLAGFGPATRPLNRILYPHGFRDNLVPTVNRPGATIDADLALDAYRCPADDGPPKAAHCPDWVNHRDRTSFNHFGTSYAANIFMISSSFGGGQMQSNSPYLRSVSGVPNPARTINYEENIGRWAWAAKRQTSGCDWVVAVDPGPTGGIRGWHGKDWTYNYAFVDGHADTKQIYIDGTEGFDGYANHYFSEELDSYPVFPDCSSCAPGSDDCPGSEGNFEAYRCVIIRGDGWQKDTMPAPLICTGLYWNNSGRASFEYCVSGD